jgi:hypothetical protein
MATTSPSPDLRGKLEQVNEEIAAEARRGAGRSGRRSRRFATSSRKAGNEANRTDSDEFKKAEEITSKFASLAEELKELEAVRDGIFGMLGKGPGPLVRAGGSQIRPRGQAEQSASRSVSARRERRSTRRSSSRAP